jgi:Mn2+ and Fe2+ transporters of the NRAMP family
MSERGFSNRLRQIGPGLIITAAFMGPGTIATCSKSGAGFGYVLLWAMTFSVIVTIVLQEMTARLGITTKYALGSAIRETISSKEWVRVLAALLVIIGIFIGNCAFETGNITGAVLGLNALYLLPRMLGDLNSGNRVHLTVDW